jgi:hypothetical protein
MTIVKLFEICQDNNDLDVMNVQGSACDNAAATMGNRFVRGNFDKEFLSHWYGSVQSILCDSDWVTPTARAFFEAQGVKY